MKNRKLRKVRSQRLRVRAAKVGDDLWGDLLGLIEAGELIAGDGRLRFEAVHARAGSAADRAVCRPGGRAAGPSGGPDASG